MRKYENTKIRKTRRISNLKIRLNQHQGVQIGERLEDTDLTLARQASQLLQVTRAYVLASSTAPGPRLQHCKWREEAWAPLCVEVVYSKSISICKRHID